MYWCWLALTFCLSRASLDGDALLVVARVYDEPTGGHYIAAIQSSDSINWQKKSPKISPKIYPKVQNIIGVLLQETKGIN